MDGVENSIELQDISNIFQGLLSTNGAVFRDPAGPTRFLRVPPSAHSRLCLGVTASSSGMAA